MITVDKKLIVKFGAGDVGIRLNIKNKKAIIELTDFNLNDRGIGDIPSHVDIGKVMAELTFSNTESLECVIDALNSLLKKYKRDTLECHCFEWRINKIDAEDK